MHVPPITMRHLILRDRARNIDFSERASAIKDMSIRLKAYLRLGTEKEHNPNMDKTLTNK